MRIDVDGIDELSPQAQPTDPSSPRYIQTVWGLGYVFIPDGPPSPAPAAATTPAGEPAQAADDPIR